MAYVQAAIVGWLSSFLCTNSISSYPRWRQFLITTASVTMASVLAAIVRLVSTFLFSNSVSLQQHQFTMAPVIIHE
eukprot:7366217-Ditylum_brightwellii.AAC.1